MYLLTHKGLIVALIVSQVWLLPQRWSVPFCLPFLLNWRAAYQSPNHRSVNWCRATVWAGTFRIRPVQAGLLPGPPAAAGPAGKRVPCPLSVSPLTHCIYYLPVVTASLHLAWTMPATSTATELFKKKKEQKKLWPGFTLSNIVCLNTWVLGVSIVFFFVLVVGCAVGCWCVLYFSLDLIGG